MICVNAEATHTVGVNTAAHTATVCFWGVRVGREGLRTCSSAAFKFLMLLPNSLPRIFFLCCCALGSDDLGMGVAVPLAVLIRRPA